jgi:hypothetical protein
VKERKSKVNLIRKTADILIQQGNAKEVKYDPGA